MKRGNLIMGRERKRDSGGECALLQQSDLPLFSYEAENEREIEIFTFIYCLLLRDVENLKHLSIMNAARQCDKTITFRTSQQQLFVSKFSTTTTIRD